MAEIKLPIKKLVEGKSYTAGIEDYLITEEHTISDILRFVVDDCCGGDTSEVQTILKFL